VKTGMRIGLAIPSGSGKSTIIQLILRLYDFFEGITTIDGVDIRQYDVKHLRQSIALVSQEPVLFSGTIRSNVDFAVGKSDEDIREVLLQAAMPRFAEDLDREVGVREGMLSGGQKQRIAVARALLRSPSILLLDEATSALDSLTEKRVSQALEATGGSKTVLTVAHRISTLKKCDFIFVLDIVEQGTHQDLYSHFDSLYCSPSPTSTQLNNQPRLASFLHVLFFDS